MIMKGLTTTGGECSLQVGGCTSIYTRKWRPYHNFLLTLYAVLSIRTRCTPRYISIQVQGAVSLAGKTAATFDSAARGQFKTALASSVSVDASRVMITNVTDMASRRRQQQRQRQLHQEQPQHQQPQQQRRQRRELLVSSSSLRVDFAISIPFDPTMATVGSSLTSNVAAVEKIATQISNVVSGASFVGLLSTELGNSGFGSSTVTLVAAPKLKVFSKTPLVVVVPTSSSSTPSPSPSAGAFVL